MNLHLLNCISARKLLIVLFAYALTLLATASPVLADGAIDSRPISVPDGLHQANFVEDIDGISVIRFSGNYDSGIGTDNVNAAARAVVAREFYRTHSDDYDFLVVFTDFEFETGPARAFHLGVSNNIEGIGLPQYSNSQSFGSESQLKGYIDMADLLRHETNPLNTVVAANADDFAFTLQVLAHETLHQWGISQGIENLQDSTGHWNFFMDTDASIEYGHNWIDNNDGTFTAESARQGFSQLDLYIMGLVSKDEVPDFFVIEPEPESEFSKGDLPRPGVTVSGNRIDYSIDDYIAVNGERKPGFVDSQKVFRYGFIYLTSQDTEFDQTQLDGDLGKIRQIRSAYEDRFSVYTNGRALARVFPPTRLTASPEIIDEIATEGDVDGQNNGGATAGITWLLAKQNSDGSWSDRQSTTIRDSDLALQAIDSLDFQQEAKNNAKQWFSELVPQNNDSIARKLRWVSENSVAISELIDNLLESQNDDGGWGLKAGLESSVLDTALILCALSDVRQHAPASLYSSAFNFIRQTQNTDGGWSASSSDVSSVAITSRVLSSISCADQVLAADQQTLALDWLLAQRHVDGGFGDESSSVHETAEVVLAFLALQKAEQLNFEEINTFVLSQQSSIGDWSGSVYETALAIQALQSSSLSNFAVTDLSIEDTEIYSGELVKITATVTNDTALNTDVNLIEFSLGDPATTGQVFEAIELPVIPSFRSLEVVAYLDTRGINGTQKIYATADPQNVLVERSSQDNQRILDVDINLPPQSPELTVNQSGFQISPNQLDILPETLNARLDIRNIGLDSANGTQVQLWQGSPDNADSVLVAERSVIIAGESTVTENFEIDHNLVADTDYFAVVDSSNAFAELNENDNQTSTRVTTVASIDLSIEQQELSVNANTIFLNQEVEFTTSIINNGTIATPVANVEFLIRNVEGETIIQETQLSLEPGESRQLNVSWLADFEGASTFIARVDFQNLISEVDENNNTASLPVNVQLAQGNNLSVNFSDLQFSPDPGLEGMGATLSAIIRNNGTTDINTATIEFYDGNPATGGLLIGESTLVNLPSTESRTLTITWAQIPDDRDRFIYVVVDPGNQVDEINESDNTAFEKFNVISLPDFAVSDQSIVTTPPFPRIEEQTAFSVRLTNRGSQREENLNVQAYLGDVSSGVLIAENAVTIEGNDDVLFEFDYRFTEFENTQITIVLDGDNEIRESNEQNNFASRRFVIQDGDFYLSDLYLSPDNNGLKDEVEYFFNLNNAQQVSVVVRDSRGNTVRELFVSDTALTSGSVIWDGKNEFGGLVADGNYQIAVRTEAGSIEGARAVTLDTNRSPLANAVDTPFGLERNLTCRLGEIYDRGNRFDRIVADLDNLVYGPNDQFVYFSTFLTPEPGPDGELITTNEKVLFPSGVYQALNDGTQVVQLVADGAIADAEINGSSQQVDLSAFEDLVISPDGKTAVFHTSTRTRDFWIVDIETGELKRARHTARVQGRIDDIQFINDDLIIFRSGIENLYTLNLQSLVFSNVLELESTTDLSREVALTLNSSGSHALISFSNAPRLFQIDLPRIFDGSYEFSLALLDLETKAVSLITNNATGFSWSPTGDRFVVGLPIENSARIYDVNGIEIQSFSFPERQFTEFSIPEQERLFNYFGSVGVLLNENFAGDFGHFTWSPDGSEFAFVAYDFIATYIDSNGCPIGGFDEEVGRIDPTSRESNLAQLISQFFITPAHAGIIIGPGPQNCIEVPLDIDSLFQRYQTRDGIYVAKLASSSVERVARTSTAQFNGALMVGGPPVEIFPRERSLLGNDEFPRSQNQFQVRLNENGVPVTEDGSVFVSVAGVADFFRLYTNGGRTPRGIAELSSRQIRWLSGARELLISGSDANLRLISAPGDLTGIDEDGELMGSNDTFVLNLDNPSQSSRKIFEDKQILAGIDDSNTGKFLTWFSDDEADQCFSNSENRGYRQFQSLLNLTADLRARRVDDVGGFLLEGSAVDQNFDRYILEFADVAQPDVWTAIAPASSKFVIDDRFTNWVAPYIGRFFIRLTVFDLAGNSRQEIVQVSNVEQASISGIFLSEQFISPNGDSVQDSTALNFRILQSVNLDLQVFNSQDQMVRSIQRSFDVIGSEQSIEWNGRDSNGQVVEDGQYRIRIQNFEFFVTVDNSAPVLSDNTQRLFVPVFRTPFGEDCRFTDNEPIIGPSDDSLRDCRMIVDNSIRGSVSDIAVQRFSIQRRSNTSSTWRDIQIPIEEDSNPNILGIKLSIEELRDDKFRLIATDFAGNTSILNIGQNKLGVAHTLGVSFGYANQPGFGIRGSFRAERNLDPSTNVAQINYQHSAPDQVRFVELVVSYIDADGEEQRSSVSVDPEFIPATDDSIGFFRVVFDASGLPEELLEVDVNVRLRLVNGNVIDSDIVRFSKVQARFNFAAQAELFLLRPPFITELTARLPVETNIRTDQIERLVYVVSSVGDRVDPRYAEPLTITQQVESINIFGQTESVQESLELTGRAILDQANPEFSEGAGTNRFAYDNTELDLIRECGYDYKVTALLYPTGSATPLQTSLVGRGVCIDTLLDVDPVLTQACAGEPSNALDIHYFARSVENTRREITELRAILLRIGVPEGSDEIGDLLFSQNLPELGEAYTFRLNTSDYAEGNIALRAVLTMEDGSTVVDDINAPVVRRTPTVDITFPIDGSKICAVKYQPETGVQFSGVEVQGRVNSSGPTVQFVTEIEEGNGGAIIGATGPSTGPKLADFRSDNVRGPVAIGGADERLSSVTRVDDNQTVLLAPIQYFPSDNATSTQGVLAIPRLREGGSIGVMVEVSDWSGARQCAAIEVDVDAAIEGAELTSNNVLKLPEPRYQPPRRQIPRYEFFSPNGDGQFDTVDYVFSVEETVLVSLEVFETSFDLENGVLRGDLVAKPYEGFSVFAGDTELQWNGFNDAGALADDGIYEIVLRAEDPCGNVFTESNLVGVDTTPPAVNISFPASGQDLPLQIRVVGSAIDSRLGRFEVTASQGPNVSVIGDGAISANGVVAEWDTFGLTGDWDITLIGIDSIGNRSSAVSSFTIPERLNLISSLQTTEYFISPNNDGRSDDLTIRVAFEQAVSASVAIKTLNGDLIESLSTDTDYSAGFHTLTWDGLNQESQTVVDDVYQVEVIASGFGNIQTATVQFELDDTPPLLSLIQVKDGFVELGDEDSILGAVSDQNFDNYEISVTAVDENQNRILSPLNLVSSSDEVDGALAVIPEELQSIEQQYLVTALATDLAGNQTRLTPFMVIDLSPPTIILNEPVSDTFFNLDSSPVDILGSVEDGFLNQYQLTVAARSDLDNTTELATGTDNIDPLDIDWNLQGIDDGAYQIKLAASDRGGLRSSQVRSIIIDNTSPIAEFSQPQELAYVTEPGTIIGSANDAHFSQYSIAIAYGHLDESASYSDLLTSGLSRNNQSLHIWSELPEDGNYTLRLQVSDKAGNRTEVFRRVIVDTTPPAPPLLIDAQVVENNKEDVLLSWQANTETDLQGYIVFRNGQAISGVIDALEYLDQGLLEGEYSYQVLAVDRAELRSELSEPLSVLIDITPPLVQILQPRTGSTNNLLVDIIGTAFSENDFKEYRLSVGQVDGPLRNIQTSSVPRTAAELGQWDTTSILLEGDYVIRLEADDVNGNSASVETIVRIDNNAPSAPENLVAIIDPNDNNDVVVSWEFPSAEPDLLGFLIYRNGELANTNEVVLGDLRQFALEGLSFVDKDRPDGIYEYIVYAIDQAGNISAPSNSDDVSLDNNEPSARIINVVDGQGFDESLYLLASSEDNDVAQVLFQFKPQADSTWLDIGLSQGEPFEFQWDTRLIDFGDYHIRVVATDFGGRVDSQPEELTVTKRDVVPPLQVEGVVISTVGSEGALSWNASEAEDLAGYNVYLADCDNCAREDFRLISEGLTETFLNQTVPENIRYRYLVTAVDTTGNESIDSAEVVGVYGTASLSLLGPQPFVPIAGTSLSIITPDGIVDLPPANNLDVSNIGFELPIDQVTVSYLIGRDVRVQTINLEQATTQPRVELQLPASGPMSISVVVRSTEFNSTSRPSSPLSIVAYGAPSLPTGLGAICPIASEDRGSLLSWDANPEADNVVGYRVFANGIRVNDFSQFGPAQASPLVNDALAFANIGANPQFFLPSNDFFQAWTPGDVDNVAFGQTWPTVREVSSLRLEWASSTQSAREFAIDALIDGQYREVARRDDQFSNQIDVRFDRPIPTTSVRVRVLRWVSPSTRSPGSLRRMSVFAASLAVGTTFEDIALFLIEPEQGIEYRIQAVDRYSGASELSEVFTLQCDINPNEPPTGSGNFVLNAQADGADILLNWQQIEPDLEYEIYFAAMRNEFQYEFYDSVFAEGEAVIEGLANDIYRVYIVALDDLFDTLDVSNIAEVEINAPLPAGPVNLEAIADNENRKIDLTWDVVDADQVEEYLVYRSTEQNANFKQIAIVNGDTNSYSDVAVDSEVEYFYHVVLLNSSFIESAPSNTVSAELNRFVIFPVPIIMAPTNQYEPITVVDNEATVAGLAQGGAAVSVLQNNRFVGNAVRATESASVRTIQSNLSFGAQVVVSPEGQLVIIDVNEGDGGAALFVKVGDKLEQISGNELSNVLFDFNLSFVGNDQVMVDLGGNREKYIYSLSTREVDVLDLNLPQFGVFFSSLRALNVASNTYVFSGRAGRTFGTYLFDKITQQSIQLNGNQYTYSPDGRFLSYVTSSSPTVIEIRELATGDVESIVLDNALLDFQFLQSIRWSPDGRKLLLNFSDGLVSVVIDAEDPADGVTIIELPSRGSAVWAGNNRLVSIGNGSATSRNSDSLLHMFDLVSQTRLPIGRISNEFGPFSGQPSLRLLGFTPSLASGVFTSVGNSFDVLSVQPSGYFEFPGILLEEGENLISAIAIDEQGNTSDPAAAISVSLQQAELPDYQLDIELNPSLVVRDQGAAVSLFVSNIGNVDAPMTDLSLRVIDPSGGSVMLVDQSVGPIDVGGSVEVSIAWVPAISGDHILISSVDDGRVVEEQSEVNNQRVINIDVKETAFPDVALLLEPSINDDLTFGPTELVKASIEVANPGPLFDGQLVVDVIDMQGALTTSLGVFNVADLLLGERRRFDVQWNSSLAILGDYQIRARLIDQRDLDVAVDTQNFSLQEPLSVVLGLRAQQFSFSTNQDARLTATVINRSQKSIIDQGELTLRIFDSANNLVDEQSADSLTVLVSGRVSTVFNFMTANHDAGQYRAEVVLRNNQLELATASAQFEIVIQDRAYVGNLLLENRNLSLGEQLRYQSELRNSGNTSVDGLTITYRVESDLEVLASDSEQLASLQAGQVMSQEREFSTEALSNNRYTLVMLATQQLDTGETLTRRLDEESFMISENQPPLVSISRPSPNQVINSQRVAALASAVDASGVSLVEARLNDDEWFSINASTFEANRYLVGLASLNQGAHRVSVRATDTVGNSSNSVVQDFIVDNTPPIIEFVNISDQQQLIESVQPVINISDEYLDVTNITLNGAPFAQGDLIDDLGDYTLIVNAVDLAGNAQRARVDFSVVPTQIVLTARNDALEMRRGGVGNIKLLSNDSFRNIGDLDIQIEQQPSSGRLVKLASGDYNYYPSLLFIGEDSLSYSLSDSVTDEESSAQVSISVRPGASCSFVPDHSTSQASRILLPAWATTVGDSRAPRFRIRITSVSDISAFEPNQGPRITFPDCSLSYTPRAETRKRVTVTYVVEDVATSGQRYTSPPSHFAITIDTKNDNSAVIVPILDLLLLDGGK